MSRVVHGDAFEVLAGLEPESVSAIVTDPPYGLEFMGKGWDTFREDDQRVPGYNGREAGLHGEATTAHERQDHPAKRGTAVGIGGGARPKTSRCEGCGKRDQFRKPHGCPEGTNWRAELIDPHAAPPTALAFQAWTREWARLAYRVLKPGGYLLAFGGTRTYHRLAAGIEDAGFDVRDTLAWLHGQGFPKSHDVSKAIDARAGAEREVVGPNRYDARRSGTDLGRMNDDGWEPKPRVDTAPATEDAKRWAGWGTALKPAHEPIVVARKPLTGSVAANVLEHGTGGLNIDACLIGTTKDVPASANGTTGANGIYNTGWGKLEERRGMDPGVGRWPANVAMDEQAAAMLDEQSGELRSGDGNVRGESGADRSGNTSAAYGAESRPAGSVMVIYGDRGGASRFFYVAKPDAAERHAGLAIPSLFTPADAPTKNDHPTVKPVALMRWLVRLVTPPGGLVVDPFLGSGTTGIACELEGVDFLGIEQDADSAAIARARIAHWGNGNGGTAIV